MPLMLLRHFFSGLFIARGGQGLPGATCLHLYAVFRRRLLDVISPPTASISGEGICFEDSCRPRPRGRDPRLKAVGRVAPQARRLRSIFLRNLRKFRKLRHIQGMADAAGRPAPQARRSEKHIPSEPFETFEIFGPFGLPGTFGTPGANYSFTDFGEPL